MGEPPPAHDPGSSVLHNINPGRHQAPAHPSPPCKQPAAVITPTVAIPMAPKTYASAVGITNNSIPDFGELSTCRGEPALFISRGEMEILARPFQNSLIARFLGFRPRIEEIRKFFIKLELKADCKTGLLDNRHVLVQPGCLEDYNRLYARGEWAIGQYRFVLSRWSLNYKYNEDCSLVPIWFEFPGLPLPLLNPHYVEKIGKLIGRPLHTDSATTDLRRPSVARVLVEVDVKKPMCNRVWLGADAHNGCWQAVHAEHWPSYCDYCKRIGHEEESCVKKHPPPPKQNKNGQGNGPLNRGEGQRKNSVQMYKAKTVGDLSNSANEGAAAPATTGPKEISSKPFKGKEVLKEVEVCNSFDVLGETASEPQGVTKGGDPSSSNNAGGEVQADFGNAVKSIDRQAGISQGAVSSNLIGTAGPPTAPPTLRKGKSSNMVNETDPSEAVKIGNTNMLNQENQSASVLGSPKSADQINKRIKRIKGKKPFFNYKSPSVWELNSFYESIPSRFKKSNIEGWNVHVVYAAHQAGMITSDSETEAEKDDETAHDLIGEGDNKEKEAGDASVPPDQPNEDTSPPERKKKGSPSKKDKKKDFKSETLMSRMRTRSQGGSYDIDDFGDYADYRDYDYF